MDGAYLGFGLFQESDRVDSLELPTGLLSPKRPHE